MAKKIRGKLSAIYGGRASAGRYTLPLSILNGMTPKQHCEKLVVERGGQGHFKTISESEDACMLYSCNFYGDCFEGAEYSYHYEVYEKVELTSETVFTLPANRTRTTIGVGESVIITSNIPVEWEISKGLVTINLQESQKVQITALDKAGSVTITAKTKYDKATMVFSIIVPSNISYSQQYYWMTTEPMMYHPKDGYQVVVGLRAILQPTTVNFGNLVIQEVDLPSINTGIFDDGKVYCHINEAQNGKCVVNTDFKAVGTMAGIYNLIGTHDQVGGGENDPKKVVNLPASSTMNLEIPIRWKLANSNAIKTMPKKVTQTITLLKNGTITIRKGNFTQTFKKVDSYENNRFMQKGFNFYE
ncbi:hypothetical protein ACKLNO_10580 [Neisseriaceae bacterium B1]